MTTDDKSLLVVLTLDILAGKEMEFEAFFLDMQGQIAEQEPGTLRFDMFWVKDAAGRCMMIEHYADQAAWDEHSRLQGERGVVEKMIEFAAGPPDFRFLEPVTAGK